MSVDILATGTQGQSDPGDEVAVNELEGEVGFMHGDKALGDSQGLDEINFDEDEDQEVEAGALNDGPGPHNDVANGDGLEAVDPGDRILDADDFAFADDGPTSEATAEGSRNANSLPSTTQPAHSDERNNAELGIQSSIDYDIVDIDFEHNDELSAGGGIDHDVDNGQVQSTDEHTYEFLGQDLVDEGQDDAATASKKWIGDDGPIAEDHRDEGFISAQNGVDADASHRAQDKGSLALDGGPAKDGDDVGELEFQTSADAGGPIALGQELEQDDVPTMDDEAEDSDVELHQVNDDDDDHDGGPRHVEMSPPEPREISDLPEVRVFYRRSEYSLFSKSEADDPYTYFFSDTESLAFPLSQFLDSLREVIAEEISREDELVIRIEGLGLEFSETMDRKFLDRTTFAKIIDLHSQLTHNDEDAPAEADATIVVFLVTRPHCQRRLEALLEGVNSGYGISSFHMSYPKYLTADFPASDDEEAASVSPADVQSEQGQAGTQSVTGQENVEDTLDAGTLDHSHAESTEEAEAESVAKDDDDFLADSYDQVVEETAQEDTSHSSYSRPARSPNIDGGEREMGGEAEDEENSHGENDGSGRDAHPSRSDRTSAHSGIGSPGQDGDGEGDAEVDTWYGDTSIGADSHKPELDDLLGLPQTRVLDPRPGQDDAAIETEPLRTVHEIPEPDAPYIDSEELDIWDEANEGGYTTIAQQDKQATDASKVGHQDVHQETIQTSTDTHYQADWDADQELDSAIGGQSHPTQTPVYADAVHDVNSGRTSASGTVQGDEIDFEDDLPTEALHGGADVGTGADEALGGIGNDVSGLDDAHEKQPVPDEIDWDDNAGPDTAGAPEVVTTPSSATGKRLRDGEDDTEGLGGGHDVKRHRA